MLTGTQKKQILKFGPTGSVELEDIIVQEAPLELRLRYGPQNHRRERTFAILMRTPGQDEALATGLLFTEQLIASTEEILSMRYEQGERQTPLQGLRLLIDLPAGHRAEALLSEERLIAGNSACGICGATLMDQLERRPDFFTLPGKPRAGSELLFQLPEKLKQAQKLFGCTGGLHAAALFSASAKLQWRFEDVGRHNALDKLIGHALRQNMLPLQNHILMLSGRISFELVQKAAMAGIGLICAIGAPSSAALEAAEAYGITLVGFLKEKSFNLYTHPERVSPNRSDFGKKQSSITHE